jgi:hypothetical protein
MDSSLRGSSSLPACKELRWRGWEKVLVGLIESVRVADDLESVPNTGVSGQRDRAVSVSVGTKSAAGGVIEEDVSSVVVTRCDAEHGCRPGQSQVHRRRL